MSNNNNTVNTPMNTAADDLASTSSSASSQSIYFIRHAHKQDLKHPFDDPEHGAKYWSRPCDTPLSDEGRHMADDVGTYFRHHPHHTINTIIVSPALRCLQTAQPISEACAIETTTTAAAAAALPMNIEEGLYDVPIGSLLSTASSKAQNNSTTTTTTPPNAAAWDYPSLPFPSLTERKCYFTNINTNYHSKISVETFEESQYENENDDHHEFYQQELHAYVSRASRTIEMIVKDFPNDNLCIVTHGAHIPIMLATLLQLDMKTTCGTHLGGAMAHMASITRIYRKKNTTTGSWGPWRIDPALANSVEHLTQHQDLLRHKGLPQYNGNPDKVKLYMSILTKEMMKSPWLLKHNKNKNNATDNTPDTEKHTEGGTKGHDTPGVNKSKM